MAMQDIPREQTSAERSDQTDHRSHPDAHRIAAGQQQPRQRPNEETNHKQDDEVDEQTHASLPTPWQAPAIIPAPHRPTIHVRTRGFYLAVRSGIHHRTPYASLRGVDPGARSVSTVERPVERLLSVSARPVMSIQAKSVRDPSDLARIRSARTGVGRGRFSQRLAGSVPVLECRRCGCSTSRGGGSGLPRRSGWPAAHRGSRAAKRPRVRRRSSRSG
jgi:hypothetical protein